MRFLKSGVRRYPSGMSLRVWAKQGERFSRKHAALGIADHKIQGFIPMPARQGECQDDDLLGLSPAGNLLVMEVALQHSPIGQFTLNFQAEPIRVRLLVENP